MMGQSRHYSKFPLVEEYRVFPFSIICACVLRPPNRPVFSAGDRLQSAWNMKISATFDSASHSPCVLRGKMRQFGKGSKQSIRI